MPQGGDSARDSGWGECQAAEGFASRGAGLHNPTSVPGCVETQASGIRGLDPQQRRPRGRTEESQGLCGRWVSPTGDTSLGPFFKPPGKEPCPALDKVPSSSSLLCLALAGTGQRRPWKFPARRVLEGAHGQVKAQKPEVPAPQAC